MIDREILEQAKESMRFILNSVSSEIWEDYHYSEMQSEETENGIDCIFTICDSSDKDLLNYVLSYSIQSDSYIPDFDESYCVQDIITHLKDNSITASESLKGKAKIMAEFDDFGDSLFTEDEYVDDRDYEYEDENEIDQDTDNIEVENNIENHFIMECTRCQGIFISALVESDQEVDSIRGICPLCNHESDQVAKWIVRAV